MQNELKELAEIQKLIDLQDERSRLLNEVK